MTLPLRKDSHQHENSNLENQEFCVDVLDLFQNRRAGHLSKWLYSSPKFPGDKACGAVVRKRVIEEAKNGSAYRVFNEEVAIIRKAADALSSLVTQPGRLSDLGPGSLDAVKEKIFPILQSNPLITSYVGVDVNALTLGDAKNAVQKQFGIQSQALNKNFIQDHFEYGPHVPVEIATMFGQTAFNMEIDPRIKDLPQQALADYLYRIRSHFNGERKYLVITQDTNQDSASLIAAHFAISDYFRCLPHLIKRDLSIRGEFNTDDFSLDITHFKDTHAVSVCLIADKSMTFSIGDEICSLTKGQRFYFHNSYKFISPILLEAGKAAGFECIKTIQENGNNCALHILQAK